MGPLIKVKDDLGRELSVPKKVERIVSCVPSLSEFIWDLGLEYELKAVTKFCVHPLGLLKEKKLIGGTKQLKIAKIRELNPDIIIVNKEENTQEDVRELGRNFSVYVTDFSDYPSALNSLKILGKILGKEAAARHLISLFDKINFPLKNKSCLYFIWKNPYMLAGNDTFIHSMLKQHGYHNIIEEKRYPEMDTEELKKLSPQYVLLSSEPYPFNEKHLCEFQDLFPHSNIKIVDGERFSWYGTRLLHLEGLI